MIRKCRIRKARAPCRVDLGWAKAVDHEVAGTIEFIADGSEGLRVDRVTNTRLQVEHAVAEEITGQELVE